MYADVTGDGVDDSVTLIGIRPFNDNSGFWNQLSLRVFDAANNKVIKSELSDFGGYDSKLFLGDFTGDKVKEIMVSVPTGGSGGIIDNRIVTLDKSRTLDRCFFFFGTC